MSRTTMQKWFPFTKHPLVVSAPMLGASNGKLASAVSQAGGLGFVPGGCLFANDSPHYRALSKSLESARDTLPKGDLLGVGVGLITCHEPSFPLFATSILPLLEEHKVCSLWLFAPAPPDPQAEHSIHHDFVQALRQRGDWGKEVKVWIQVGSVAAAKQAVRDGADIIVAQGVDAGGHQFAVGAGTIGLVPETVDAMKEESAKVGRDVAVIAAGGITDGRGIVAALGLGAQGAVMGTRFYVATESEAMAFKKQNVVTTVDGGLSTVKSTFHDDIQGTKLWPKFYDGRAIVDEGYSDFQGGLSMEESIARFKQAAEAGETSRAVTWSGTGVGLVKQEQPAGEIVEEVRSQAREAIEKLSQALS